MAFDGNRSPELETPQKASSSSSGGGAVDLSGIIDRIVNSIFSVFRRFLAGLTVDRGLTVNNGLTSTQGTTLQGGAEVSGGLGSDIISVSNYLYIGTSFTVGSYRLYRDTTSPLPKLQIEQLTSTGVWTWIAEFGPGVE